jgi:hypothetical protein
MAFCENHEEVEATYLASMPCAYPPYTRDVPLCAPCGERMQKIGFPVRAAVSSVDVEAPQPEGKRLDER